jgi:hypothetical protein
MHANETTSSAWKSINNARTEKWNYQYVQVRHALGTYTPREWGIAYKLQSVT